MTASHNITAYLRPAPRLPLSTQRDMAADAGIKRIFEHGEAGRQDVRSALIRSLRPGDTLWLPRLDVLAAPEADRVKGKRRVMAKDDLAAAIADVLGRGAIIVDGMIGVTSRDGAAWADRVQWAMRRVSSGIPSRAEARKRARKGGAAMAAASVANRWLAPAMDKTRERWAAVWRDPKYPNAQAAADALPEPLTGRVHLARRIFDGRDPARKGVGGRPPKRGK